jgi:hypothetical protein
MRWLPAAAGYKLKPFDCDPETARMSVQFIRPSKVSDETREVPMPFLSAGHRGAAVAVALLASTAAGRASFGRCRLRRNEEGRDAGHGDTRAAQNPHSWVFLEGTDEKGQKVEWQIEMAAAASLGWTPATLPVGTVVKVVGSPSRAPGSHGMTGARFTLLDGTPVGARLVSPGGGQNALPM